MFNCRSRSAPVRITKSRHQVRDLDFTLKHIPDKQNPAGFMSRHLAPIEGLFLEKERQMMDEGEDITIMGVICNYLLLAEKQEMIQQAGEADTDFRQLKQAVQEGQRT